MVAAGSNVQKHICVELVNTPLRYATLPNHNSENPADSRMSKAPESASRAEASTGLLSKANLALSES